jgi:hypothetical protein
MNEDISYQYNSSLQTKIDKLIEQETAHKGRTWSFYKKLMKDDPTDYWKPTTQARMFSDAEKLGDDFKDGDFYD